jgi:uncharacterized membrane-anchored protein YhcB (DUF1043 family)
MPVSAMKTFFSRAFLMGLAVGLLTARLADYKIKKKNNLPNLGVTPGSLTKAARHEDRYRSKGETRWLRSMST